MRRLYTSLLLVSGGFLASCGGGSGEVNTSLSMSDSKALRLAQQECTFTVTPNTPGGIQGALNQAKSNGKDDTICIEGTFNLTETLTYELSDGSPECGKKLIIKAIGSGATLDGGNSIGIMKINTSACGQNNQAGEIAIEGIRFQNGKSFGVGGGLYIDTYKDSITLKNNTFNSNSAIPPTADDTSHGGGALIISNSGSITLTNNTFIGNTAEWIGGALVFSLSGSITLSNNTFSGNTALSSGGGAGVYSDTGLIKLINNTFTGNRAQGSGDSSDDLAQGGGGALVVSDSGSITLMNNTFNGNSAKQHGGGALVLSTLGSIILTNNIFSGNTAEQNVGGAFVSSESGSITLTNNTFSGNSAKQYGGGLAVELTEDNASLHLYNNIFWNNIARAGGNDGDDLNVDNDGNENNTASPVNIAHNLFSTSTPPINFATAPQTEKVYIWLASNYNQSIASGCTSSGNYGNIQADPRFIDAQNGNLRLQQGSPAINAGCNSAPGLPQTDRDGNQRILDGRVDMGAYEFVPQASQPPTQPSPSQGGGGGGGGCSMGLSASPVNGLLWLLAPAMVLLRRARKK